MEIEFCRHRKENRIYGYIILFVFIAGTLFIGFLKHANFFLFFTLFFIYLLYLYYRDRNNIAESIKIDEESDEIIIITIDGREFKDKLKNVKYSAGGYMMSSDEISWIKIKNKIKIGGLTDLTEYHALKRAIFKNCKKTWMTDKPDI